MIEPREEFMFEAILQANLARERGDYAIGAVIVNDCKIIFSSGNKSKTYENPTKHAEIIAISEASRILGRRHLNDGILYTTNEPCVMCTGAAVWAKLRGIVYGSRWEDMRDYAQKYANESYLWRTIDIPCKYVIEKSSEQIEVVGDFMREECLKLFHC
ncbi:nucleoside deaminase [Candidatus Pacearchaeota archaeon]|nr:nucleoside deaminase [Candidatus Pacearchaeota archaeon]